MTDSAARPTFEVRPIGVIESPVTEKVAAPRQPRAAEAIEGRVVLWPELVHAVEDLAGFEHIWVLAWMDRATTWRQKVLPPRSEIRRGVFATRAPHRPNPIALSVLELVRVEGTTLHVRGLDLLDGTPVLDVKPYVPWADAIPRSRAGWLEEEAPYFSTEERPDDPRGAYEVIFSARARAQVDWLAARGVPLEATLRTVLEASPLPHPYRRIKRVGSDPDAFEIGLSEWRFTFVVIGRRVEVRDLRPGKRARLRAADPLHAAFEAESSFDGLSREAPRGDA